MSTTAVRIQADSFVIVFSGCTELGHGSRSSLAQIVADRLEIETRNAAVLQSDTGTTIDERTTGASRAIALRGLAMRPTCANALSNIASKSAGVESAREESVHAVSGGVEVCGGLLRSYGELARCRIGANASGISDIGLANRDDATK